MVSGGVDRDVPSNFLKVLTHALGLHDVSWGLLLGAYKTV